MQGMGVTSQAGYKLMPPILEMVLCQQVTDEVAWESEARRGGATPSPVWSEPNPLGPEYGTISPAAPRNSTMTARHYAHDLSD